jgi:6-bladed beta-propeller
MCARVVNKKINARVSVAAMAVTMFALAACTIRPSELPPLRAFASVFKHIGDINLQGIQSNDALAFTINSTGSIYVIDRMHKHVKQYDSNGQLIRTIGSSGNMPGQFSLAWSLACDQQDRLYVLDVNQSRVHMFDKDGVFQKSITFSSIGTPGITLAVANSGDIYIGVFAVGLKFASGNPDKFYIHKYDQDGNHTSSFFPMDDRVERMNLSVAGGVRFNIDPSGNLYAVQQVNPQFFKFSPNGQLLGQFGKAPDFYKAPIMFPRQLPKDKSQVDALLAKWTQLINIFTLHPDLVLLTYRIHSPEEYALEVYNETGNLVIGRIGTPLLPLFSDNRGVIYFRQPLKKDEQLSTLKLSRFSIEPTT